MGCLVYGTHDDHVTQDTKEGVEKLDDLRSRVMNYVGFGTAAIDIITCRFTYI